MATYFVIIGLLLMAVTTAGQQTEEQLPEMGNNLEQATAANITIEDDADQQLLNALRKRALGLNSAGEASLQELGLLTALQIDNFLQYRAALGKLVSIYELQAIPGFDLATIKRILPYVRLEDEFKMNHTMKDYLHSGNHTILLRYGRQVEQGKGYETHRYQGSPDKMFARYRYNSTKYLSFGLTMEKDPGEWWLSRTRIPTPDHYGIHLFIKNYHWLKALAVGDFTVNMGQGLLNWQSQAYNKGAGIMLLKRTGEVLRPYTSAGEYNFFRGAGLTAQHGRYMLTAFVSYRRLDGSIDSTDENPITSSIATGGYHRTETEIAKKGNIRLASMGGNIKYAGNRWHAGLNFITHTFTPLLQKTIKPYNQYAFAGKRMSGASADFAAYWKNVHVFGEVAASENKRTAMVLGVLTTLAPSVDFSLVFRSYDKEYHSLFTNSFGNYYQAANEYGCYAGIVVRMSRAFTLSGYSDFFRSPWLRYRKSAPTRGNEFNTQLIYTPGKRSEFLLRYVYQVDQQNVLKPGNPLPVLGAVSKMNVRVQGKVQASKTLSLQTRFEYVNQQLDSQQQGIMVYGEIAQQLNSMPLTFTGRITWFTTTGYESRIYATESSVLYENSVAQLYGKGWQYYLNIRWKVSSRLTSWWRFHRVAYPRLNSVGTGYDEIKGTHKSLVQLQLQYSW